MEEPDLSRRAGRVLKRLLADGSDWFRALLRAGNVEYGSRAVVSRPFRSERGKDGARSGTWVVQARRRLSRSWG